MRKHIYVNNVEIMDYKETFKIEGGSEISLSEAANYQCGESTGLSFDAFYDENLGGNRVIAGVISKQEAKRLADFIYSKL